MLSSTQKALTVALRSTAGLTGSPYVAVAQACALATQRETEWQWLKERGIEINPCNSKYAGSLGHYSLRHLRVCSAFLSLTFLGKVIVLSTLLCLPCLTGCIRLCYPELTKLMRAHRNLQCRRLTQPTAHALAVVRAPGASCAVTFLHVLSSGISSNL